MIKPKLCFLAPCDVFEQRKAVIFVSDIHLNLDVSYLKVKWR